MPLIGPRISRLSTRSLLIGICNAHRPEPFTYGTGFVADTAIGPCLLTARHCVTGLHHYDGSRLDPNGNIPSSINIYHRILDDQGRLLEGNPIKGEPLYDDSGMPRWYEHPQHADLCDFICLPLTDFEGCGLCLVHTEPDKTELTKLNKFTDSNGFIANTTDTMSLHVSDQVSVIGYPFGAVPGHIYPLWSTGHISSEPYVHSPFGVRYIDCRARGGQSGSPVYAVRSGSYEAVDDNGILFDGHAYMFLGLYSGRIRSDSDIGIMWEARVIHETAMSLAGRAPAQLPTDRKIGGPITYMPTLTDALKAETAL